MTGWNAEWWDAQGDAYTAIAHGVYQNRPYRPDYELIGHMEKSQMPRGLQRRPAHMAPRRDPSLALAVIAIALTLLIAVLIGSLL